jgi:hypothetical protein
MSPKYVISNYIQIWMAEITTITVVAISTTTTTIIIIQLKF